MKCFITSGPGCCMLGKGYALQFLSALLLYPLMAHVPLLPETNCVCVELSSNV